VCRGVHMCSVYFHCPDTDTEYVKNSLWASMVLLVPREEKEERDALARPVRLGRLVKRAQLDSMDGQEEGVRLAPWGKQGAEGARANRAWLVEMVARVLMSSERAAQSA